MTDNDPKESKETLPHDTAPQDTVVYDGDCPMCRAFRSEVEKSNDARFVDLRSEQLPPGITESDAISRIHLVHPDGSIDTGYRAALALLENTRWGRLARIAQLPILRAFADLSYRFIAHNRLLVFGPGARLFWIKIALVIGFLVPFAITRKLWFGEHARFYALTPVWSGLPSIDYPLDYVFYTAIAALLICTFFAANARALIIAFLAVSGIYSLWDQSRWMPYNYQFWCMFLVLAFYRWDGKGARSEAQLLSTLRVIMIGIWLWSGIHKVNARYLFVGYPWMLSPFTQFLPEGAVSLVHAFAFLTPFVESTGALALLFRSTRTLGVIVICGMHLFILLVFGPLGLNFNHSVWSWNLVQIALCCLLFLRTPEATVRNVLIGRGLLHHLLLILFLIMPVFNIFGYWDDFLSHALYSWSTKEAEIVIAEESVINELPVELAGAIETHKGQSFIHVLRWSYLVFESPPYHAHRVFKSVFQKVCHHVDHPEWLFLRVFERPSITSLRSETTTYRCGEPGTTPIQVPDTVRQFNLDAAEYGTRLADNVK